MRIEGRRLRWVATCAVIGILLSATTVNAADDGLARQPERGSFTAEPYAGLAVGVGGVFVKPFNEVLLQAGTVGGIVFSTAMSFEVAERDFQDVYRPGREVGIQFNYGLSDKAEVFGGVSYMRAEARTFDALLFTFGGTVGGIPIAAGSRFFGEFEDYQEVAGHAGYRRFFDTGGRLTPFVGGRLSVRKVSAIDLHLRHDQSPTTIENIRFYKPSVAFGVGAEIGFRYDVYDNVALGVTTGINYRTELAEEKSDIVGFREFQNANERGDIVDIPVSVRMVVRF